MVRLFSLTSTCGRVSFGPLSHLKNHQPFQVKLNFARKITKIQPFQQLNNLSCQVIFCLLFVQIILGETPIGTFLIAYNVYYVGPKYCYLCTTGMLISIPNLSLNSSLCRLNVVRSVTWHGLTSANHSKYVALRW